MYLRHNVENTHINYNLSMCSGVVLVLDYR